MRKKNLAKLRDTKLFLGLVVLLGALVLLPHTSVYKKLNHLIWERGYHSVAYYLNYADGDLALQTGYYYFGSTTYDLHKAASSFRLAVKEDPGVLWGHYQLARIYFVQGKFDKALQEIQAELDANPANLRSLYVRGLIYISMGNLPKAEEDFRNFIVWAPTEWGGYNDLAFVLAKQDKHRESEEVIVQAMEHMPEAEKVAWLWNSLGLAQLNQQKYSDAEISFEKARTLAESMTAQEWIRAYSANNPALAVDDIKNFQKAIQENISTARAGYLRE